MKFMYFFKIEDKGCSREYLYCGTVGNLLVFGLKWLQPDVKNNFSGLSDDGYKKTMQIKSSCLAVIMFSTLIIL